MPSVDDLTNWYLRALGRTTSAVVTIWPCSPASEASTNYSADLQGAVRTQLGFDESTEARVVSRLTNSGIVQRGYSATRIVPDVLADHLLVRWFLDPSTKQYDFRTFIFEPFLRFKARDILRNLAEAEYHGEAPEASTLLSSVLQDLVELVREARNGLQHTILVIVGGVGTMRPDEALYLVDSVLNAAVPETTDTNDLRLERWHVLSQAVHVLDQTEWPRPVESLRLLFKLSRWDAVGRGATYVRTQARKSVDEIFEIEPRIPFSFYESALGQLERWIRDDADTHGLCAQVLAKLVTVRMMWAEQSPENKRTVSLGRSLLAPGPVLRRLRDRAFAALRELYVRTSDERVRKLVIDAYLGLGDARTTACGLSSVRPGTSDHTS
jgi:hypothetical protein